MAKKKRGEREVSEELLSALQYGNAGETNMIMNKLEEISNTAFGNMSEEEKVKFSTMFFMAISDITPEEYAQFYQIFQLSGAISEGIADDRDPMELAFPFSGSVRKRWNVKEYEPLKEASQKTLVLKIQMKDVSKPPMWREVEVPADYSFLELHDVIQEVTGLEDSHLWQFGKHAYDDSLVIGIALDDTNPHNPGLDFLTDEASETPLTRFLQQKGDKLEYVYDFGDDWIFTVEVKELCDKKITHPACRKYKGELNAIEDFGGIWSYLEAREQLETWGKKSKKERKKCYEERGFDSEDEYIEFLNSHRFSLDDTNEGLEFI